MRRCNSLRHCLAIALLCICVAAARDAKRLAELFDKGAKLSPAEAEKLEAKLERKQNDEETRIELLAFYTARPEGLDLTAIKRARAKHILWIIEHDPKQGLGLFAYYRGIYRLHCAGDDLADPQSGLLAVDAWLKQIQQFPADEAVRREAIAAMQYCA